MGFASYFLIVWDYMRWARENGVGVGPGRGSAAGSLVAYALRIVDLDPLAHGLLFERFLNPGRKSMPDIDTDFSVAGRDRVVQYVTEKYGTGAVARIGTFGKLLARAVVRDAGRVLGHTYGQVDRIAKLVPERPIGIKLADAMKPGTELAQAYADDPIAKEIIDTALPLEGLVRNEGVHAAGVVIAPGDITSYVPVRLDDEGNVVTQVPDHDVEALGLLKMDFLGLRNLDVIQGCLALIEERQRLRARHRDRAARRPGDLRDARPRRGDRRLPVRVERHARGAARGAPHRVRRPDRAGRPLPPGPDGLHQHLRAQQARPLAGDLRGSAAGVDHRPHLRRGGVPGAADGDLARRSPGSRPSRADDLRKAVGKKDKVLMASLKDEFIDGCVESGTDRKVAQSLWSLCEAAGDYSFNKSHAACYALLAYRTAYLKANHPAEYMASLLSSVMDTKDRVPVLRLGLLGDGPGGAAPDVNVSRSDFAVTGEREIRFGLTATKGVGENAVSAIIAARDAGGRVRVASGTSAAGWTRPRSTSAPWRASCAAARSTRTGATRAGHARDDRRRREPGHPPPQRPRGRPGVAVRRQLGRRRASWWSWIRRSRPTRCPRTSCWRPRRRRWASTCRATRSRTAAASWRGR